MGITDNLGLSTYNTASGSATTFLTFRLAVAGTESNMELIDEFAGWVSGSIVEVQSNLLVNVNASMISPNYYEATISEINSYLSDSMIALKVNVSNTGSVTLNINELDTITLKKIGSDGELTNLESGDLKADRHTLFVYDGTYYVLMGATTADQVNIYGNEDSFVSISGSGTLQDSGISGSSVLQEISGSGVMSDTSGSIVNHNESGIVSGSYNNVYVDDYGHAISGSQIEYQTESDVWGSGVMSDTSGSAVAHNTSAVTSGSYNKVEVDEYGHITSGSQMNYPVESTISGSDIMSDTSGSVVKHNESGVVSGSYITVSVDKYGHVTSGSTTVGLLTFNNSGSLLETPVAGTLEFYDDRLWITNVGKQRPIDRTNDVIISTTTVVSSSSLENLFTAAIDANDLKVGNLLKIFTSGVISNNAASDDVTLYVYMGETELATYTVDVGSLSDDNWHTQTEMTVRSTGSAATLAVHGQFNIAGNESLYNSIASGIDLTVGEDIHIKAQWSAADVDNSISIYQGHMEFKN